MEAQAEHAGHSHSHGLTSAASLRNESKSKLLIVLSLTSVYMIVEVIAAIYTGSLALLADAGHMLSDVASIVLALVAIWFASKPATSEKTYGYYRSEILAGLINSILLVGICIFILWEAYHRLANPPAVVSGPMIGVALIGLIINVVSLRLLGGLAEHSLNVKAAYLEVMGDLLATAGVIGAGVIMLFSKWYYADPLISGAIGLMILPRTWILLSECVNILMEGTPGHIDLAGLRKSMLGVSGVIDIHDIHVWTITSGLDAMSGHVTINRDSITDDVLAQITHIAQHEYGIHHTTIQVEQVECKGANESCAS